MSTLLKLGFSCYVFTTFLYVVMQIFPTKSTFSLGKNFGDTRHPCGKNEPSLDRLKWCNLMRSVVYFATIL